MSEVKNRLRFKIFSVGELVGVARDILSHAGKKKIFLFYGEMGAGKTTLIKYFCKSLGVKSTVSSPTFSIVNEYIAGNREPVFHFDFYRINSVNEVHDIGLEEYFSSGNFCLVEWAEKIEGAFQQDAVKIRISVKEGSREIEAEV
jgi:tRNA threonylcarbamoyladenosine biosynthesis protein TsaE